MKKETYNKLMEVGNEEVQQFLREACPEFDEPTRKERDKWFLSVLKDLRVGEITENYVIWENSRGKWIFQDTNSGYFWCSWDKVWSVLRTKYNMEHYEIQDYIKSQVLKHLNWKVETPYRQNVVSIDRC